MHSNSRQRKSVPSQDKRTLSPLIFYIQCYKTQAQSMWQISHFILLLPHWPFQHWSDPTGKQVTTWQPLCRDNAPRSYLAWPVSGLTNVTHQKCLYRNSWSRGEIVTAGFDLLFCWILSLCPQPRLWMEWTEYTAHSTGEDAPSSTPRWFQVNSSCRTQSRFPLNSPEGQASRRNWNTNTAAWCFRSIAKIQQLFQKSFSFRSKFLYLGT